MPAPARLPPPKPPRAPSRALTELHYRMEAVEEQIQGLVTATQKTLEGAQAHIKAVAELTSAVSDLKTCTTNIQMSLAKVVQDSDDGRKIFENILNRIVQDKAFTWTKLGLGSLVVSTPGWFPQVWKLLHG